jgi:hypothetical protein
VVLAIAGYRVLALGALVLLVLPAWQVVRALGGGGTSIGEVEPIGHGPETGPAGLVVESPTDG